jgi:hypothetical protein
MRLPYAARQGVVIAGLAEGLARSADSGCSWAFARAALGGAPIIDLTVRADRPSSALALAWDTPSGGYASRFWASDDNGLSFSPYGVGIDPSVFVLTLDVAPTNAHRVYASGTRTVDGVRTSGRRESSDENNQTRSPRPPGELHFTSDHKQIP